MSMCYVATGNHKSLTKQTSSGFSLLHGQALKEKVLLILFFQHSSGGRSCWEMSCVCNVQQLPLTLACGAVSVMQEDLWDGVEGSGWQKLEVMPEVLNRKNKPLGKASPYLMADSQAGGSLV